MKLSRKTLEKEMQRLESWKYDNEQIQKTFKFADFIEAFGFMSRVALCAQQADHHPDWSNSYRTVDISLTTHSEGGVTQKDILLAQKIEALLKH